MSGSPTISQVNPNSATYTDSTKITINGSNLLNSTTKVTFGGAIAPLNIPNSTNTSLEVSLPTKVGTALNPSTPSYTRPVTNTKCVVTSLNGQFVYSFNSSTSHIELYTSNLDTLITTYPIYSSLKNTFILSLVGNGSYLAAATNSRLTLYSINSNTGNLTVFSNITNIDGSTKIIQNPVISNIFYVLYSDETSSIIKTYQITSLSIIELVNLPILLSNDITISPDGKYIYTISTTNIIKYIINTSGIITNNNSQVYSFPSNVIGTSIASTKVFSNSFVCAGTFVSSGIFYSFMLDSNGSFINIKSYEAVTIEYINFISINGNTVYLSQGEVPGYFSVETWIIDDLGNLTYSGNITNSLATDFITYSPVGFYPQGQIVYIANLTNILAYNTTNPVSVSVIKNNVISNSLSFTYEYPISNITISDTSGSKLGGTSLNINGNNLADPTIDVYLGLNKAIILSQSYNQISILTPEFSSGLSQNFGFTIFGFGYAYNGSVSTDNLTLYITIGNTLNTFSINSIGNINYVIDTAISSEELLFHCMATIDNYLYVATDTNSIGVFTSTTSSMPIPLYTKTISVKVGVLWSNNTIIFHSSGRWCYILSSSDTIQVVQRNTSNGTLGLTIQTINTNGTNSTGIYISNNDNYIFVCSQDKTITSFSINQITGTISYLNSISLSNYPVEIALHPLNSKLYILLNDTYSLTGNASIAVYDISNNGILSLSTTIIDGLNPNSIKATQDGLSVYVLYSPNIIHEYASVTIYSVSQIDYSLVFLKSQTVDNTTSISTSLNMTLYNFNIQNGFLYVISYNNIGGLNINPVSLKLVSSTTEYNDPNTGIFTYKGPFPSITSILDTSSGSTLGGYTRNILGTQFTNTSLVTFGGAQAIINQVNDTSINVIVPPLSGQLDLIGIQNNLGPNAGAPNGITTHQAIDSSNYIYVASNVNNLPDNGGISSYKISEDGSLTYLQLLDLSGESSKGIAKYNNYLYVTNTNSNNISMIDISNNGTLTVKSPETIDTSSTPYGITVLPINSNLIYTYVANYGSNNITIYDTSSISGILTRISQVDTSSNPITITFSKNGAFAYVANYGSSNIGVYDVSSTSGILTHNNIVDCSGSGPKGTFLGQNGLQLYVVNYNTANINVFDTSSTGALIFKQSIETDGSSSIIKITTDNKHAYVTNTENNRISLYDIDTNGYLSFVKSINTSGESPLGISITSDEKYLYVTNTQSNSITEYNLSTVPVIVTNEGIPSSPSYFTYVLPQPNIVSIIPPNSVIEGGAKVTINGYNLYDCDAYIGDTLASNQIGNPSNDNNLYIVAPPFSGKLSNIENIYESSGNEPYYITTLDNKFVYTTNRNSNNINKFDISSNLAVLSIDNTFNVDTSGYPDYISIQKINNNIYAYITCNNDNVINIFDISGISGQFTQIYNVDTSSSPQMISFTTDTSFAFVPSFSDNKINSYQIDNTNGNLVINQVIDGCGNGQLAWITVNPNNNYLYAVDNSQNKVLIYDLSYSGSLMLLNTVDTSGISSSKIITDSFGKYAYILNTFKYISAAESSISLFDISNNGSTLILKNVYSTGAFINDIIIVDDMNLYCTYDTIGGLGIITYKIESDGQLTEIQNKILDYKPYYMTSTTNNNNIYIVNTDDDKITQLYRNPVDVTITNSSLPTYTDTSSLSFTYIINPTATNIIPSSGSTNGGTSVQITGTELLHATATFGGTLANISGNTITELDIISPPRSGIPWFKGILNTSGTYTYEILAHPNLPIVYASNQISNNITIFNINILGNLTYNSIVNASGVNLYGIAISLNGNHLYISGNSSKTISVFDINNITGLLTYKSQYIYPSSGLLTDYHPRELIVSPDGKYLYVTNNSNGILGPGGITAFNINQTTGNLTYLDFIGSGGINTRGIACSPQNTSLYVTNTGLNTITQFSINDDGTLSHLLNVVDCSNGPVRIRIHSSGLYAYVINYFSSTIVTFLINQYNGHLNALQTLNTIGSNPTCLLLSINGLNAYVGNSTSNNITTYSINYSTGLLSRLDTLVDTSSTGCTSIAMNATGSNIYISNNTGYVSQYKIDKVQVIVTAGGKELTDLSYNYIDTSCIALSITPSYGSILGGTIVNISGTGLLNTNTLAFYNGMSPTLTSLRNIVKISDNTITAITPPYVPGTVNVLALGGNSGAFLPLINGFTYGNPPKIMTINPNYSSVIGGTTITITGIDLSGVISVLFGNIPGTNIIQLSNTIITVLSPSYPISDVVDITLNTLYGTDTSRNAFRYIGNPTISEINPSSGSKLGGTQVIINGTDLDTTTSVTFDNISAIILNKNINSITVITPAHSIGPVDVKVTTNYGNVTVINGYTYGNSPEITSLIPDVGTVEGGTIVTITGIYLEGTTSVLFGDTESTILDVSNNQVIVSTLEHSEGIVIVKLTTPFGIDNSKTFTYSTIPGRPIIVNVEGDDQKLKVTFDKPVNGGVIEYYEYSLNNGLIWTKILEIFGDPYFFITGLINGVIYPIIIRGVNDIGFGPNSNIFYGTPNIICILKGSQVLLLNNRYVLVEELKVNDLLKTPTGYTIVKSIISFEIEDKNVNTIPFVVKKDYYGKNIPFIDTYLSPNHAIKVNNKWIHMIHSKHIQSYDKDRPIIYYHIETQDYNTDIIYVNGLMSETWDKNYEFKVKNGLEYLKWKCSNGECIAEIVNDKEEKNNDDKLKDETILQVENFKLNKFKINKL